MCAFHRAFLLPSVAMLLQQLFIKCLGHINLAEYCLTILVSAGHRISRFGRFPHASFNAGTKVIGGLDSVFLFGFHVDDCHSFCGTNKASCSTSTSFKFLPIQLKDNNQRCRKLFNQSSGFPSWC